MSYTGSDDLPLCDGGCNRMCPPGYPGDFIAIWPVTGPVSGPAGRMTRDRADNFHLCWDCLREMALRSSLSPGSRALALRSSPRWRASQHLLDQAEDVIRGAA